MSAARGLFIPNPTEPTGSYTFTAAGAIGAIGDSSIAIGERSQAVFPSSIVIGTNSYESSIGNPLGKNISVTTNVKAGSSIILGTNSNFQNKNNLGNGGESLILIGNNSSCSDTAGANLLIQIGHYNTITVSGSPNNVISIGNSNNLTQSSNSVSAIVLAPSGFTNSNNTTGFHVNFSNNAVSYSGSLSGVNITSNTANAPGANATIIGTSAYGTPSNCVVIGNSAYTNSGSQGVVIGYSSNISGTAGADNIVIGNTATVSASGATCSVAIGKSAAASNIACVAIGPGSSASTNGSVMIGNGVNRTTNSFCIAPFSTSYFSNAGYGNTAGAYQAETLFAYASTTNATQTTMYSDGTNTTNRFVLANNSTWAFFGLLTARRTDSVGDVMAFSITGCITRGANAASTTLVGTPAVTTIGNSGSLTWSVAVSANTSSGDLQFQVTGEGSKTIHWLLRLDTVETT